MKYEVTAVLTAHFQISANSSEDAINKACMLIPSETQWDTDEGEPVYIGIEVEDFANVRSLGIMDTSNNHDRDLVRRINNAYDKKKQEFTDIALLLIHRDLEEYESVTGATSEDTENDIAIFLNRIADNKDLEIILNYCRM